MTTRGPRPKSSIFGSLWGPQIDRKSTSGPTKCGRFWFLSDFYSMLRLAQFFDSIWGRFFMKNRCFFQCDFLEILFFFNLATLTKHSNLHIETYFFTFSFFVFSSKNDQKTYRAPRKPSQIENKTYHKFTPKPCQNAKNDN